MVNQGDRRAALAYSAGYALNGIVAHAAAQTYFGQASRVVWSPDLRPPDNRDTLQPMEIGKGVKLSVPEMPRSRQPPDFVWNIFCKAEARSMPNPIL
jgi:hypothetical protein